MNPNSGNKRKPFLFDRLIFDEIEEEIIEEEEDLPPPPPTFSEEELAMARQEGYKQGEAAGREAEKSSREQHVAQILQAIDQKFQTIFAQEKQLKDLYETEAVALTSAIIEKLFPAFMSKYGPYEIAEAIKDVLRHQEGGKVHVSIHDDYVPDLQTALNTILSSGAGQDRRQISVTGDNALDKGNAQLSWQEGGATHRAHDVAQQIMDRLRAALALSDDSRHNSNADAGDKTIDRNVDDAPEMPLAPSNPDSGEEDNE